MKKPGPGPLHRLLVAAEVSDVGLHQLRLGTHHVVADVVASEPAVLADRPIQVPAESGDPVLGHCCHREEEQVFA